jgi:hypothetical protein
MTKTLFDVAWEAKFIEQSRGPSVLMPDFLGLSLVGTAANPLAQGNNKAPTDPPGLTTIGDLVAQLTEVMAQPQSQGAGTPVPDFEAFWWKPNPPGQMIPEEIYWKNLNEAPPWNTP